MTESVTGSAVPLDELNRLNKHNETIGSNDSQHLVVAFTKHWV